MLERVAVPTRAGRRWASLIAAGSAALALVAAYLASSRPDALERAIERLGIGAAEGRYVEAVFPGYDAPGIGPWLAALVGVLLVFALGYGLARVAVLRRSRP
jgi:hypothetical protein